MSRSRRNVRAVLFAASFVCGVLVACSAFDLGDVVEPGDDATTGGSTDASDAGIADGPFDGFGPCVAGGDPCACLDGAVLLTTSTKDPGAAITIANGSLYFSTNPTTGNALMYAVDIAAPDGGIPTLIGSTTPLDPSPMIAASHYLFFRRISAPVGISRLDEAKPGGAVPSYFAPEDSGVVDVATNQQMLFFGFRNAGVCAIPFDDAGSPGPLDPCNGPPVVPPFQPGQASFSIAASATTVFVMFNGKIFAAPIGSGVATPIVLQPSLNVTDIAEDNGWLFWVSGNGDAGAIWTAPDDGGVATAISNSALEGSNDFPDFAVDDAGVYWSGPHYNKLWAANRNGTGTKLVACEDPAVFIEAVTSDDRFIYWVDSIGGVWRAPKP